MRHRPPVIKRAEADIAAGELWRARDRLNGSFKNSPTSFEVIEMLGDVYMQMGDQPAAGRWWYLSATSGERHDAARAAYEALHGGHLAAIRAGLPRLAADARIPAEVQARLDGIGGPPPPRVPARTPETTTNRLESVWVLLIMLATVGVWLVGVGWLISLVV